MQRRTWPRRALSLSLIVLMTACARPPVPAGMASPPTLDGPVRPSNAAIHEAYGRIPLHFEENQGQADPAVRFLSRGQGYGIHVRSREILLRVADQTLRMDLVGARRDVTVAGLDKLPGTVNYFVGPDPAAWRAGVPTYARVKYTGLYPGIDAILYGNQGELEYDFVVAPGADLSRIRLRMTGTQSVTVDAGGDLRLVMKAGTLVQRRPVLYQDVDGRRVPIAGGYVLRGRGEVGFRAGAHDRTRPLVIDPVVRWMTMLGGTADDSAHAVAVTAAGEAFIAGSTSSANFPAAGGAQPMKSGGHDAFVTKFDVTGSQLLYSTYLGGSAIDQAIAIAIDASGAAYIAGQTGSTDFPLMNPFQAAWTPGPTFGIGTPPVIAFVAKLNPSGSALEYSTYLGGPSVPASSSCRHYTEAFGIAVDASGSAYVTGDTRTTDFPVTPGAMQTARADTACALSAFVTKLTPAGNALAFSTYVDGVGDDSVEGIALDPGGNAYVAGTTAASPFPVTASLAPSGKHSGGFVLKLSSGGAFVQGTIVGPAPSGIAVDASGQAHVGGFIPESDTDFATVNGAQPARPGGADAFVAKLNAGGTAYVWSTYLGDSGFQNLRALALAGDGRLWVFGQGMSSTFPLKSSMDSAPGADYVVAYAPGGAVLFSSPVPASGLAAAIDGAGNAYVATGAGSGFIATAGAFQTTYGGGINDAALMKIELLLSTGSAAVSITAPGNGAWTGNSINVSATAGDSVALESIALWGNGAAFGTIPCSATSCSGTASWITGSLTPGAYEIHAVATDSAGKQTLSPKVTINKDGTAPLHPSGVQLTGSSSPPPPGPLGASITSPANGATVSGTVAVNMAATNAQGTPSFVLKVDNTDTIFAGMSGTSTASDTWDTTTYANGTHTLNLTVTDTPSGNTATAAITVTVNNPPPGGGPTPPTVTITSPSNNAWTGNSINVSATASDNVQVVTIELWGNGAVFGTIHCTGATCSGTKTWVTGGLPPGAYEVQAVAKDNAGTCAVSAAVKINKDGTSPVKPSGAACGSGGPPPPAPLTLSFTKPASGATVSGTTPVELVVSGWTPGTDGVVSWNVNGMGGGANNTPCPTSSCTRTFSWNTTTLANGTYELKGGASNGGRTASASVTVTVSNPPPGGGDTTVPTVAITKPSNGAWTGNSIDIVAAGSDNVGLTSIAVYGNGALIQTVACNGTASCNTGTVWWATGSLPPGQHTITAVATDTAGNQKTSAPVTINK